MGIAITTRSAQEPDSVRLSFMQRMDVAPEVMHLMYAVGTSPQLGYHNTRMCFELKNFSPCETPAEDQISATSESKQASGVTDDVASSVADSNSPKSSATFKSFGVFSVLCFLSTVMFSFYL